MNSCAILAGVFITLGWFTKSIRSPCNIFYSNWGPKEDCRSGFSGDRCQQKCQYPNFGRQCKGICNCKQTLCHYKNGCPPLAAVCPTGFTGTHCDDQCKYPNYGYGCQQQCLCPKARCNFVYGCSKRKPNIARPYPKTKSSSAPMEKKTIEGITEKQPETFVNTETKFHKEFTFGTQSDSQRGQHTIKGITEKKPETFVNTESKIPKGFTWGTQFDSQRGQETNKHIEKTSITTVITHGYKERRADSLTFRTPHR